MNPFQEMAAFGFGKMREDFLHCRVTKWLAVLLALVPVLGLTHPALAQGTHWQIQFSGNRQIHSSDLKKLWTGRGDSLDSAAVLNYLHDIVNFYRQKGFYFVRIDSFHLETREKSGRVKIWLHEGKPLRLGKLDVQGATVFDQHDILNRFALRRGHIFHQDKLRDDLQRLLQRYADRGYPLTCIQISRFNVDSIRSMLNLTLKITEGPVGKMDSIEVRGNKITQKRIILRELGLHAGERFSRRILEQIPVRLKRLPFLRLSAPVTVRWDSSGRGHVLIPVHEENMAHFDGTIGYNPSRRGRKGQFTGLIDLSFQNLLGTGRVFSAFWQKKEFRSQEIRLFYKEPWILNRPLNASLSFEQKLQDSTYIRRAWSTGIDFRWLQNFQLLAQVGRESILPDSLGEVLLGIRKSQSLRFSMGVQFDTRDDWLNPRSGLFYHTAVDLLRRKTENRFETVRRTFIDFEGYWNWIGRQVWALQLHGREVRFPGIIPVEEKFFLGGSRTLRGYREDEFRGSRLAWSNLEYRYLVGPKSRVFLFADGGWIMNQKSTPGDLKKLLRIGYGLGVRLQTTLGIVGLDYGLGEGDSLTEGKIHLRLINQF